MYSRIYHQRKNCILSKQNAIWTSWTRLISSKNILVRFQQGWKNRPQVALKTTGLLPGIVKVISDFKVAVSNIKSIRRLLGSQGLKCLSFQAPNIRFRQTWSSSVPVHVVLTWAPLTTFQIALPTTAQTRFIIQIRPYSRAKTPPISKHKVCS